MSEVDLLDLCRLDDRQPSTRDRWRCFYRLWRGAQRHAASAWFSGECFRVLMSDWRWIQLVEGSGDRLGARRMMPVELRKQMLTAAHRRRMGEGI